MRNEIYDLGLAPVSTSISLAVYTEDGVYQAEWESSIAPIRAVGLALQRGHYQSILTWGGRI